MNIKNPEINVPILIPETVKVKPNIVKRVVQKTVETFSGWMNWLVESGKTYIAKPISSSLKNLKEKINKIFEEKDFKVREGESALKKFVREYIIDGKPGYYPQRFFELVKNLILKILKENKNTKVKLILNCKMERKDLKTGETEEVDAEIETNLKGKDENKLFEKIIARIDEVIANFQQRGSNWVFVSINQLEIHIADWKPLGGSSYISLPQKIRNKNAVINMKNEDDQCFKWCVVRPLNPVEKNSKRITKELKDQSVRLNWDGLTFPVDLKQIKIFEKNNPQISINVFGLEKDIYPLRIPETQKSFHVDLLLLSDEEKQHYCLIKNLSRLISNKLTKHCGSVEICQRCLNHFPNKKS